MLFSRLFPLGFKKDCIVLCRTALPIVLTCLISILIPLQGVIFSGHLGAEELGAVSIGNLLFNIIGNAPIHGLSSALDTLFPQLFGGEDKKRIGIVLQKSLVISILTGMVSSSIFLNIKYLLFFVVPDLTTIILADGYMKALIPSIFIININIQLNKYVQSQGIVIPVTIINGIGALFNLIVQYLFVYKWGLGINGSAYGVAVSSLFMVIMMVSYIRYKKIYVETWSGWSKECFCDWGSYLKLAIPGFFMLVLEWAAWETATLMSSRLGTVTLDIMSITQQMFYISYQFPWGLATAGNIYIGNFLGANKPKEAINAIKVFFVLQFCVASFDTLMIIFFSSYLPYIFSSEPEIIEQSSSVLKIVGFIHFLDCLSCSFSAIIRTVGAQFKGSIIVAISFYIIGLPVGIGLMLFTDLKLYGLFLGFSLCIFVMVLMQFFIVYRTDWIAYAKKAHENSKVQEKTLIETTAKSSDSFKTTFLKRGIVYLIVISIFSASYVTNSFNYFENSMKNNSIPLMFNNTSN